MIATTEAEMDRVDNMGMGLAVFVAVCILVAAYFISLKWGQYKGPEMMGAVASDTDMTASPIDTTSPASNAPVLGPPKPVIVPIKWDQRIKEGDFTFPEKSVVRWDLVPPSSKVVTIGFRMKNPPLTGKSPNDKIYQVLATDPASGGLSISMKDRGTYEFSMGRERLTYERDFSYWQADEEIVELRVIALSPTISRVELLYNNHEIMLHNKVEGLSVSTVRSWPQYLRVFHREKIADIWVTFD